MKTNVGLWIDHKNAVIVTLAPRGEEMVQIQSKVEKHPGRSKEGGATTPYEALHVKADDSRERRLTRQLNDYYDSVIEVIGDPESILIFGPGEAKIELRKRLAKRRLGNCLVPIETVGKLTNRQIAEKVRKHFHITRLFEMEGQVPGWISQGR